MVWRICSRYLNLFLINTTKHFSKRPISCGLSVLNYDKFKRSSKFRYTPLLPIAFSFLYQKESTDEIKSINDKPQFKKIIWIIKTGKFKELNKDYDKAEELYHEALEGLHKLIAKNIPSAIEISQTRSYIFDCMANLSFIKNDFDKAENLFKEVLRELIVNQKFDHDDNAIIEISLKLSMIYAAQQKYNDAIIGYKFCIDALEKKLFKLEDYMTQADTDSLALYGVVSEAYSKFLYLDGKWLESMPYLQKSFEISKRVFGDAHPQIAVISNDLGVACIHLNDNEEALKHFEFAADVGRKCNSPDLPHFLFNMADLLGKMNNLERAQETLLLARECCNEETPKEVCNRIFNALESESTNSGNKESTKDNAK